MKNILIAGGTKGIGLEVVNQLVQHAALTVIARSVEGEPGMENIRYIQADLSQPLPENFTLPEVLDGLIYCPGSINLKPFHRLNAEDFMADMQVNFLGAVRLIQAALPALKKSSGASVVLFSTVAVGLGMPFHASIAAAKGAVEGLTRSLAAELAPAIRVNCIAPSLTNTPLAEKLLSTPERAEAGAKRHPLQRVGTAAEIAGMACFLLSAEAAWMTGQVIHLDGGMSAVRV